MKAIFAGVLIAALVAFEVRNVSAQARRDEPTEPLSPFAVSASNTSELEAEQADFLSTDSPLLPAIVSVDDYAANATDGALPPQSVDYGDPACCDPAGFKFSWGPDKWARVGAAIRSSFNSQSSAAPGIGGNYFTLNNARLLTSGQVTQHIGFDLNSDIELVQTSSPATVAVPTSYDLLDAIVRIEAGDLFNVWAGQFLPPSDRSTLSGPFFINAWDFPFVSDYPAVFQGRQIGAAYWGQWAGGQIKWSVGAFNGTGANLQSPYTNPPDSPPNPDNNLQLDARVSINFLDPEPGYYNRSTYYGQHDILAVGFAIQTQNNAVGTAANPANFTGMNWDALFEKKLANAGVVTLEGALYRYDDQDLATSNRQGKSGFAYLGYMFPYVCNIGSISGRWRPFSRYQQYKHDFLAPSAGLFSQSLDIGVEYVLNGPSARITAVWSERDVIGSERIQLFTLGAQVMF